MQKKKIYSEGFFPTLLGRTPPSLPTGGWLARELRHLGREREGWGGILGPSLCYDTAISLLCLGTLLLLVGPAPEGKHGTLE